MMSRQDDLKLLGSLKSLYSRIMVKFMGSWGGSLHVRDGAAVVTDIASPLSKCIDKVVANPALTLHDAALSDSNAAAINVAVNAGAAEAPPYPVPSFGTGSGELASYFRSTHKHTAFPSDTGEKLVNSTWEHIFASVRAAHNRDEKKARLHVDLANYAFKEAMHYLPTKAYVKFSREVMQELADIHGQKNE